MKPGSSQALTVELDGSLPDEGLLRVQVRASRAEGVDRRVPTIHLSFGFRSTDQGGAVQRVSKKVCESGLRTGNQQSKQPAV